MKNTKEIQPILTALWCLNHTSEHKDKDVEKILEYAFGSFFGANTNLLVLATLGKSRDEMYLDVLEMLTETTKYKEN